MILGLIAAILAGICLWQLLGQPAASRAEILLDGEVYICDPEIEMNYWWLAALNGDNSMYTDNFMMLRRNAGNWNYQAVGRN